MTVFTIKIIAIVTMLVDHVGLFLIPGEPIFRIIGRVSFPLFAWLIANGAKHTKDINHYLKRLFMFALISQAPFYLALKSAGVHNVIGNVLFTLFFGLLAIKYIEQAESDVTKAVFIIICALAAHVIKSDYGLVGVLSIVTFYLFFDDFKKMVFYQSALYIWVWYLLLALNQLTISPVATVEPLAILALAFIYFYNGKPGPKAKYLFYIIYPTQFIVFYLLRLIFSM